MIRRYAWIAVAVVVVVLAARSYNHGKAIAETHEEAYKASFDLVQTNVKLEALEKRVKELEDVKSLDEERIAELEGHANSK